MIGVQDQDAALSLDGARKRLQTEGLPLLFCFGVRVDIPWPVVDTVSRKKLLRRGTGRSAGSRVESKFRPLLHGSVPFNNHSPESGFYMRYFRFGVNSRIVFSTVKWNGPAFYPALSACTIPCP